MRRLFYITVTLGLIVWPSETVISLCSSETNNDRSLVSHTTFVVRIRVLIIRTSVVSRQSHIELNLLPHIKKFRSPCFTKGSIHEFPYPSVSSVTCVDSYNGISIFFPLCLFLHSFLPLLVFFTKIDTYILDLYDKHSNSIFL